MQPQKNKYSDMKNKVNRLDAIKAIVSGSRIGGQEELLEQLRRKGFELTQATLSRDLKSLQIVKIAHQNGGYQYVLPEAVSLVSRKPSVIDTPPLTAANNFFSIAFSGQMVVMKTRPGYAGGTAFEIDSHAFPEFLGSVAGDDTVLLVLREGVSHEKALSVLRTIIPNIAL